jgi:hypothetical protein
VDETPAVRLVIPPAALKPLIEQIASELLTRLRQAEAAVPPGQLAFPQAQAARMLGLNGHQLRDERLRGNIQGCKIVGGRVVYEREELVAYLANRRMAS